MATTTDADIARNLAQAWADEYASTESGWLHHDGGVWRSVTREGVLAAVSDWIYTNVQSADPREIHTLRSTKKAQAVLSLLSGRLAVSIAEFDAEWYLLNTPEEVIDLRTGKARFHLPSDRFTKRTAVVYNPGASRKKWERALEAVPEDTRDWLQLQFGVSLFGRQSPEARITILNGGGQNAKTTIAYGVRLAVGDYGMRLDPEAISSSARTNPEYHMADLKGARFILAEELEDKMLNEAVLKRITDSGEAKGRHPGGRPFSFALTHDLFISTNSSLRIRNVNRGTTRRFAEVPFPYTFKDQPVEPHERKRDSSIKAWFETPREEVLAWLVEGAVKAYADSQLLNEAHLPKSVKATTDQWIDSQNTAQEFVTLRLVRDDSTYIGNRELLSAYNEFRREQGHRLDVTVATMLAELRETVIADLVPKGGQPMRSSRDGGRDRVVMGLRLRTAGDRTLDPAHEQLGGFQ
jgi:P4 family phage/plasmid primase-like protien